MGEASLPLPRSRHASARLLPHRLLGDDRLAQLASEGDRQAFAAIYERHHQALFRYCRSILRDDEDARDALQSTMTRAMRALEGERREIALKPWLFRIAHNEAISLARRRRPGAELTEAAELPAEAGADPATRERLRELLSDLAELPERQRGALVMRELTGLSYEEIGLALGVSVSAATQTVYEARQGLLTLAEGREMDCVSVTNLISESDRRRLRGRKVRAHLRACSSCRDFELALRKRPAEMGALFPALPAGLAAPLLHAVLGGSSGGAGGSSGGLVGGLLGGGSKLAGASVAMKTAAVVAVTATATVGSVEVARHNPLKPASSPPAAVPADVAAPGAVLRSNGAAGSVRATPAAQGAAAGSPAARGLARGQRKGARSHAGGGAANGHSRNSTARAHRHGALAQPRGLGRERARTHHEHGSAVSPEPGGRGVAQRPAQGTTPAPPNRSVQGTPGGAGSGAPDGKAPAVDPLAAPSPAPGTTVPRPVR